MSDFRATKVISSIKSKNSYKECDNCKVVEILKHQSCREMCLADSIKEQKLVSEKIKKTLNRPLGALLSSIFEGPHPDITQRLKSIEQKIDQFNNIKPNLNPESEPSAEKEAKLKMLEEKLNRIEDLLNTRAAEIYDLKEQVQILEIPKEDTSNLSELIALKDELKKQKKILDDKKFVNDGARLDVLKIKKEKPARIQRSRKELDNEISSIKEKNKYLEKMIERLEILQKGINDRTRLTVNSFEGLQESVKGMQDEQRMMSVLKSGDLVKISKNVFSSYRSLKDMQEKMITKVNVTLEKLKSVPGLIPKIVEIQEEIQKQNAHN